MDGSYFKISFEQHRFISYLKSVYSFEKAKHQKKINPRCIYCFHFICAGVVFVCICMYGMCYVCAWCPQKTEEGVRSPGPGVAPVVNDHLGAGNQTCESWGEQPASFITEASV